MVRRRGCPVTLVGALLVGALLVGMAAAPVAAFAPSSGPAIAPPVPLFPASGFVSAEPPRLQWTPVAGAVSYGVELSTSATFPTIPAGYGTAETALVPPLLGPGTYWWRVKALGVNGHFSALSPVRFFTVKPPPFDAPVPSAPANGASFAYPGGVVPLRWSPAGEATGYEVQFAANATFTSQVGTQRTLLPTLLPPPNRLGSVVHWRVRALRGWTLQPEDTVQASTWSVARQYTMTGPVAGVATGAPVLLALDDGATPAATADVVLRWTPIAGAIGYQLQLVRDAIDFDIVSPEVNVEGTVHVFGDHLQADTAYKWRVRAIDAQDAASDWSETRHFTMGPGLVAKNPTPLDGEQLPASAPRFVWHAHGTAPMAFVEFDRSADFLAPLQRGPQLSEETEPELAEGDWYWRIWTIGHPATTVNETRRVTIVDDVPPAGFATLGGGGALFVPEGVTTVNLSAQQHDEHGTLAAVRVSPDRIAWTSFASSATGWSTDLPITDAAWGGSAPGRRDLWIQWEDAAGNRTAPAKLSYWYAVEQPTPPDAPADAVATAGDGSATVSWSPPASSGDWPVTGYEVVASPGDASCATAGRSCRVVGLANGVSYTFAVRAHNEAIEGPAATTAAVTPRFTAPTASIGAMPTVSVNRPLTVTWTGVPRSRPITGYDVRYRRARYDGAYGAFVLWRSNRPTTGGTIAPARGYTYCFSVRARDSAGLTGAWSTEVCTAAPLDDRALARSSGGWALAGDPGDYAGTVLRSSTGGSWVRLTGIAGHRVAVVVRATPGSGRLRVLWNGRAIRTIDLATSVTSYRQVVTVINSATLRRGTLELRVIGGTGTVRVDGVAVRR